MIKLTFFVLICFLFFSCQENHSKELEISIPKTMKFLGHKGSGPIGTYGNRSLIENTWESIQNAVNSLDGSEIDLQMSADSTLWLFHDHELLDCNELNVNFGDCTDKKIDSISHCQFENKMLTFEKFVEFSKNEDWNDKIISLDLKVLSNPSQLDRFSSQKILTLYIIEKLQKILNDSNFDVLFEVPTVDQYNSFNKSFNNRVYLVNHAPSVAFLKTEKEKNTNLSLPLKDLPVGTAFFKAQDIQLWTINSSNDFFNSLKFNPTFIQSDNIPLMSFFKKNQNGASLQHIRSEKHLIGVEISEFNPLFESELTNNSSLVEITSDETGFPEEFLLTFSVFDSQNEPIHWEGFPLNIVNKPYIFINTSFLKSIGGEKYSINIWNKSLSKFQGEIELNFFSLQQN